MITNRNLRPGTRLVGVYRGVEYTAKVTRTGYRLADGRTFKSMNAVTMAIGCQANGWGWWRVAPKVRRTRREPPPGLD